MPQPPQLAGGNQLLEGHASGLQIFAVSGHQVDVILLACLHHALALLYRVGEGLLTKHVLPRPGRAYRLFGMQAVDRSNENRVDLRMLQASVVVFITVAILDAEFSAQLFSPLDIVADQGNAPALLAVAKSGQDRGL